jgi:hypothetical protein
MALKSYSFKTRDEAIAIEKATKELFKEKIPTKDEFKNKICILCPHSCTTCTFCWGMFCKFKTALVGYEAPLTILKILISGYYDSVYIPTFYFLKTNICNICGRYGQGCNTVAISDACPSRYLIQMDSNEHAKLGVGTDEDTYDTLGMNGFSEYDYANGRTYAGSCHNQIGFARNTKPKLSINGEKMQELVNKLFWADENEHT